MNGPSLFEQLRWHRHELAAEAASGSLAIKVGQVGSGSPKALITAGLHGDEGPWGALALRQLLGLPSSSLAGRLAVVFAANPLAAQADARNAPIDGLDLNRVMPGSPDGSHSERLAAALAPIAADSDVVIDLHGGGSWCVNAFAFRFPGSEDLAAAVGAPLLIDVPEKAGTLTHYARSRGARVVAVEMGGRSRAEHAWRERIAIGVERVLRQTGVLSPDPTLEAPPPAIELGASRVLRPPLGGLFEPGLREEAVGTVVPGGTELGRVFDLRTLEPLHTFVAPFRRTALMLLRPHICVLEGGAMTYVVAEPKEAPS